ncbi:MAG: Gfo/Idh/MocA family oxidoreductase [Gemmatimonadaceae bacterium]|nr:Gfo/Idh/MocA family oxidoreductase [Gemmatimonadaceae bacterium]
MSDKELDRRSFVGGLAAAGALAAMPQPLHALSEPAPQQQQSQKMRIACIGVGGMGATDVRGVAHEEIVALCDVDWKAAEGSFRANPKARRYKDYREMLEKERNNIDAVTVSTPDHSHAAAAMMALKMGKHVYCQKPLARTIGEVRALKAEAAKRPKQATQMGNQGHALEGIRLIREWVEAGLIGTVSRVEYWTNRPIWPQAINRPSDAHNVPPTLDWNLWLGPAEERPYHPRYAPFNWRGWWDFGTGAMGDMACHIMDAAYWTFGLKYPSRITPESTVLFAETAPAMQRITYEFPAMGNRPGVTLNWRDGSLVPPRPEGYPEDQAWPHDPTGGQLWIGDKGMILAGTYAENPRLLNETLNAEIKAKPVPVKYPRTEGVYKEWLSAAKNGTQPGSNFAGYAGPMTEMILIGCLAVRMGRTLEMDPDTGVIKNVTPPSEWVNPTYRAGWSL